MPRGAIEEILSALLAAHVEFVVVGGVAVVLRGYPRLTADLDLVVRLERDNVLRALGALSGLGYVPRAPVPAALFAEPEARARWAREKGMRVFSLWSERHLETPVDLFVEEPLPFPELARAAIPVALRGLRVPVASIPHLLRMKRATGRSRDLEDVEALEQILGSAEDADRD